MQRYIKRLVLIISAMAASVLLSACGPITEVQRRVVVHAVGIDEHPGGYEVSYQIFSGGDGSSGGPVDASESTVVTLLAQGRSLYETEESLRLQTGKEVFLGDTELIVISEDLEDEPLDSFLEYFRRSDVYLGTNVVYCRGKAKDTIGAKLNQNSATAILLRGVIESAAEAGRACSSRIIAISNALEADEAIALPILTLEKEDGEDEDQSLTDLTVGVFGSLLVSGDGKRVELDENEVMGIRLLRADAAEMSLEIGIGEKTAGVKLEELRLARRVEIRGGRPVLKLTVGGQCSVMYRPPETEEGEIIEAAERQVLALCESAYRAARDSGEDVFSVGRMLRKYEPEFAEAAGKGLKEAANGAEIEVLCDLSKYSP